jgi:hypothetical protein
VDIQVTVLPKALEPWWQGVVNWDADLAKYRNLKEAALQDPITVVPKFAI